MAKVIKLINGVPRTQDIEETFKNGISLSSNQSNSAIAELTFDATTYKGVIIDYVAVEATTNDVRAGRLVIATNGTDIGASDIYAETDIVPLALDAQINGTDIEVVYTSGSNGFTISGNINLIK